MSRLDAAKIRSSQLIEKFPGHPVSIEAFAGESRIVTPFTLDTQKLHEALGMLSPDIVSTGGSDIVDAVNNAFTRFETREAGTIIPMSDGDDRPVDLTALHSAVRTYPNIRVVSIGIGGSELAPMIVGHDILGNIQYKTFEGKILQTKLEADNLKDIAKLT
ncbi:MAG: VWA domain-containing protein [Patescibacteria group bacterium]